MQNLSIIYKNMVQDLV